MEHCKKCIHYDICKIDANLMPDDFVNFFPHNENCGQFKDKADVVEVVRCKNCKRCFINTFGKESNVGICNKRGVVGAVVQLDDYCSYGEKRDGATDTNVGGKDGKGEEK